MANFQKQPGSAGSALGTTMRIEIDPEALRDARRGRGPTARQPVVKDSRPVVSASPLGGVDFQQLLQSIYDGAFVTERSGRIVVSNIRANQFLLAEPGQLQQYSIQSLIRGADETLLPTILSALENNRFVFIQAHCLRLDGSSFPADISVNQITLGGQDYLNFFVRDITVRKEQEDRLRTGHAAIQNASSGIAIAGLDAEIEFCNPAFSAFFGDKRRNFRECLCQPELADELIEAIGRGESWSGELELTDCRGGVFFGHTTATPSLDEDGALDGMVFSVLDITVQKRAQQQLQEYASELRHANRQMQEDLRMACELNEALLPRDFERFPRHAAAGEHLLAFRHLYCPSGTIGGDFYDIHELSEHEVAVFVCDVMGHGVRAALVVATIRGLLEQLRPLANDPGAFLTQLNAAYMSIFKQQGGDVVFVTALYVVFDVRSGTMRFVNAGHPRPFLLRPGSGEIVQLKSPAGALTPALGLFPTARYPVSSARLAPGDILFLFTDGLAEAESPDGEVFEAHRLGAVLRENLHSAPGDLLERLLNAAREFSTTPTFSDDICLLAMQVLDPPSGPFFP